MFCLAVAINANALCVKTNLNEAIIFYHHCTLRLEQRRIKRVMRRTQETLRLFYLIIKFLYSTALSQH